MEAFVPTPREILADYHRAMLERSADDLADLYAVDAVHEFPLLYPGLPDALHGREEIRATYKAAWGATPARLERIRDVVVHETADPEVIVAESGMDITIAPSGERLAAAFVLVMRVRDGLITHVRDYLDAYRLAKALGRVAS